MKKARMDKFDIVMANLKPVEPSASFDFEFRRKLQDVRAKESEETRLERIFRIAFERIRYALLPQVPVMVRVVCTFIAVTTIGIYLYALQPAGPSLLASEGVVLVRGADSKEWSEIGPSYTFKAGDTIMTKEDSGLDMALSNKYAIRLKGQTTLTIAKLTPRYGKATALFKLVGGKIFVNIEEGFKPSRFIVDTDSASAKALGTKFSVDVSNGAGQRTNVSVLEGKVEVGGKRKREDAPRVKDSVVVASGQKTIVGMGEAPAKPERLIEREWQELEELYQVGKRPQVILLIKNTPDRARQLLEPCAISISDEKPRQIPGLLEDAVLKINDAINTGDIDKHREGIKLLERIVDEYPNKKYDVQLLLYIGAYYEYLSMYRESISTFEKVLEKYPDSPLASVAICAIGIIYDEKLNDRVKAHEAFRLILEKYPNSLEAIWVEKNMKKEIA